MALFLKNSIKDTLFIPEIERKIINFAVICGYLANDIGPHALAGGRRRTGTGPKIQNNGYGRQATGYQAVRSGSRNAGATRQRMPGGHAAPGTTENTGFTARTIRPSTPKRP